MERLTDDQLLQYLNSGETRLQDKALRFLYSEHYGLIEHLVTSNHGTEDDAADVMQNGMLAFFNLAKQPGFRLTSTSKTFLYAICRNQWLMRLRKDKRITTLEDKHEYIPLDDDFSTQLETDERNQALAQLLDQTGPDCKRVLVMFFFYRMRMEQIRKELNFASEQVAKNKKHQCMKRLREIAARQPGLRNFLQ
ncbi:MAG: sigma-70 family RNA polymerase sigma factor [Lewinellaceae bacterium]|nr:sigma-70 family RNA polymerase sigma factor [Saprospiraceae bacterium]MCB9338616.1 sigma-70 family RNA polymerase sigma factor [Lewinellaceae bacterium]